MTPPSRPVYVHAWGVTRPDKPGPLPDSFFQGIDENVTRSSDRLSQLALLTARKALEGIPASEIPSTGMVCGIDAGIYPTLSTCLQRMIREGHRSTSPQEFSLATPNIPHSLVSIHLGLKGPNTNISSGTLSSLLAIGVASQFVGWGRADRLIAGGASSVLPPLSSLASPLGLRPLTEAAAFFQISRDPSNIQIIAFRQRRTRKTGSPPLWEPLLSRYPVDRVLFYPAADGSSDLPSRVPSQDVREFHGEALDASGALAVAAACNRLTSTDRTILVLGRDSSGREEAALLLQRA